MGKIILALCAVVFAVSAPAAGPASTLYLTAGGNRFNARVLAGTTTAIVTRQQFNTNNGEDAIAVTGGSIRTSAFSDYEGFINGGTYDLNFNGTGPGYATSAEFVLDGTTDGLNNYGGDLRSRIIYRYDLNWGSPIPLFTLVGGATGITYDPYNSSLWISGNTNGLVQDYSLDGKLLSSFNDGYSQQNWLAFDPADGTLWLMGGNNSSGIIDQFSTTGTHLQTVSIGAGLHYDGAEFEIDAVPEPTALALFGLFGVSWVAALRRQNHAGG
jgi:hypothetical protein